MNASQFEQALSQLTEQDFQAILDGQALIVDQDQALKIGRPDAAFVIYELGEDAIDSVEALKAHLVENAEALIAEYYQFNPISREQFQRHIQRLFAEHGPQAFVGLNGQLPERVIFAENGELVCEDASSPRFKYGIY
ncbi:MAG: hypothetical protein R3219_07220, partial [Hydrogenovibrio sp.]|nr:hypothetical protein [Hydrogenovibrio sp.]